MIAYAGFCRLSMGESQDMAIRARPRWSLDTLEVPVNVA